MASMDADRLQNRSPAKIPVWFCRTNHRNVKNICLLFLFQSENIIGFCDEYFHPYVAHSTRQTTGTILNYILFSFMEVCCTGWDRRDGQDMELT